MNALLGKRVGIGISDPWELGEALGWATLQGTISHVGQTPTHYNTVYDAIIVELEKPLEYRNQHLKWLHLGARHEGRSVFDLDKGAKVSCNFSVIPGRAIRV